VVAAASANAPSSRGNEPGHGTAEPRLARVLYGPLLAAPVRIALALAGLLAAAAVGLDERAGLLAFAAGAFGAAFILLADRRFALLGVRDILPAPPETTHEPTLRTGVAALFPSTVGTAALTALALAFDTTVAALLAGILLGMAIAGLLGAAQIAAWEREREGRLFADRRTGQRFVQ
jgi:hypothetical protein